MIKYIAFTCSGLLIIYVPKYLYKIYQYYIKKSTSHNNIIAPCINHVMFFRKTSSLCRNHLYMDTINCAQECCPVKNLRKIKDYLDSARDSLYVCIYALTCEYLKNAIVAAKKRGVTVRIISDIGQSLNKSSKVSSYELQDIEVRYSQTFNRHSTNTQGFSDIEGTVLMHHKFVVIDHQILMMGSINWTMSAFFGNYESIFVTNNPELVENYTEEFMKLWDEFKSNNYNLHRDVSHVSAI